MEGSADGGVEAGRGEGGDGAEEDAKSVELGCFGDMEEF